MDIVTQRMRADKEKQIMKIIDNHNLTNDPHKDFSTILNKMLKANVYDDTSITYAKTYFMDKVYNSSQHVLS